ncbi:MAG: isoleucine--tRNA ligase [Patescibacteria group bacterium]
MEKSQFALNEEKIIESWNQNKIFEKTLAKNSPKGNFVFFEGPPTANGRPGIHHILARAFKDVICRFRTMQGYHVERKAGWDTHGLPVELQVEKALGISGKPDIEKYGIEAFNEKCKESVWQYKKEWEDLTRRIGFWLDLENPYITYDNNYIESLWWILKEINNKGLLYSGYKVVPQCPRCGTALSSHEVAQGYKNVEENSVFMKFKVKNEENTYLLSWTTTPWTLPGNVALAVGGDIIYTKVLYNGEKLILAKNLLEKVLKSDFEIIEEMTGEKLKGIKYEPLFPGYLDAGEKDAWFVETADFVTTVDGTGIVHTAVMYGEDDFNFGKKYNLPFVHTVDEAGKFKNSVTKWVGKFVKNKEVEKEIIADLKERNLLFGELIYAHDYPFCWRCDTPLLYYAKDSWFIKVSAKKDQLLKNNKQINWVPEHIKEGRFGEWLKNINDWSISRQRYWGTPIPIWQCDSCKETEVMGSFAELEKKVGSLPKNKNNEFDIHRPFIDELTYKCSCGGTMKRTPDVFDCWFDSGAMPFAQHHYPFENQDLVDKNIQFPAEYISEAIDQTRGWFYTLLAVSTMLDKGVPYKNVICLGHIRDKEGKKMSKSKGNVVDPWMIADKYGIDALRLHLFTVNQPGDPKNFDEKDVADVLRKSVMLFGNVVNFYEMYKTDIASHAKSENILDKWIISKYQLLNQKLTNDLENYHVFEAGRSLLEFIDELSTWYVRRSRDRFKIEGIDKNSAEATLLYIIENVSKIMAPFMPFAGESFFLRVNKTLESVHLADWPKYDDDLIDLDLIKDMDFVRQVVELGLAARDEAKIKVRQPLRRAFYKIKHFLPEYEKIIAEELNVWEVSFFEEKMGGSFVEKSNGAVYLSLDIEIDEELKNEGMIRDLTRQINNLRKNEGLTINDKVVLLYETDSKILKNLFANDKLREKLISSTLLSEIKEGSAEKEIEVEGEKIKISLKK